MSYHMEHTQSTLYPAILRKYLSQLFIETGTNVGSGIKIALAAGFPKIISIEEDEKLWIKAREQFASNSNVELVYGSSPAVLRLLAPTLAEPCTIFLDAHSIESNPLLGELQALLNSPCRTHTILIDDVRMMGTPDWHGLSKREILHALEEINKGYRIKYEDTANAPGDLMVATFPPVVRTYS